MPSGPIATAITRLRSALPHSAVLTDPAELASYDCDGLLVHRGRPAVVVLAHDADQVRTAVAVCADLGVPFVARGSGTGLSGGALPHADGVLVVMSGFRGIGQISAADHRAVVDPGVINLAVTQVRGRTGHRQRIHVPWSDHVRSNVNITDNSFALIQ